MTDNVYAFVVGIEKYDQFGWNVPGPCANALSIVEWLLSINVPGPNIFLFIDPREELGEQLENLARQKVQITTPTRAESIDTFWRVELPKGRPANSRLLVYWSGHGFAENDNSRLFICRDYTNPNLNNRVFNADGFLTYLRSDAYRDFPDQIILADVCATYTDLTFTTENMKCGKPVAAIRQLTYFATPEGEYARGDNGRGVFTQIILDVLSRLNCWPKHTDFTNLVNEAFDEVGETPFRVSGRGHRFRLPECVIGTPPKNFGGSLFDAVYRALAAVELPNSVFRPHYLRTVQDLGQPEMANAQGLSGMLRELTSLRDAVDPDQMPYGLIQFLLRLSEENGLAVCAQDLLKKYADAQGNAIANAREKIDAEKAASILIVDVEVDRRGEIAAFTPYLRTRDLSPLPGPASTPRTVGDWTEFSDEVRTLINELDTRSALSEIHFVVDGPLFDRMFHAIPMEHIKLGEEFVVVLRHRKRVFPSCNALIRNRWDKYAEAVRAQQPKALKLLSVPGADVPDEKGLCYVNRVVPPATTGNNAVEEKRLLVKLLDLGIPYLYWIHSLTANNGWDEIEPFFSARLSKITSLDEFPAEFTTYRRAENHYASFATLLWDDPQFNPFGRTTGVHLK